MRYADRNIYSVSLFSCRSSSLVNCKTLLPNVNYVESGNISCDNNNVFAKAESNGISISVTLYNSQRQNKNCLYYGHYCGQYLVSPDCINLSLISETYGYVWCLTFQRKLPSVYSVPVVASVCWLTLWNELIRLPIITSVGREHCSHMCVFNVLLGYIMSINTTPTAPVTVNREPLYLPG